MTSWGPMNVTLKQTLEKLDSMKFSPRLDCGDLHHFLGCLCDPLPLGFEAGQKRLAVKIQGISAVFLGPQVRGKSKLHGNLWVIFKEFPTIDASPLFGVIHHDLWIHLLGFVCVCVNIF